ncbi:MAG: hypothetical protein PHO48_05125 [Candidatus Gracilibacteria bacterium]|nr:hypothetical protein [Candidatus Gracilibacteria bacterium]
MKKLFSRFAAIAATVAMLASYATIPAYAAGVVTTVTSADRQNFTLALPAGVDLDGDDVITLRITTTANGNPVDLSANPITSAILGGGAAETLTENGDANGQIIITESGDNTAADSDLAIVFTSALATNTAYTIAYSDTNGNISAAMINFGTANVVSVTAIVEPTLTLALSTNSVALGILSPSAITAAAGPVVSVATNAQGGFVLSVADSDDGSGNAGLYSASLLDGIAATVAAANGIEGFNLNITEATDSGNAVAANANDFVLSTSAASVITGNDPTVYTANTQIEASISPITPAAADYATNLTFTATATF